jgi:hypothetical protein
MTDYRGLVVREAIRLHYHGSGLPSDGGRSAGDWALMNLGPVRIRFSNFAWRQRALACHDLHHLLTGYPCTVAGELQIAAWEFAAGRFPNVFSTLFCLPLVGIGALAMPTRSFAAFVRGRRSLTLYAMPWTAELLCLSVQELRCRVLPRIQPTPTIGDLVRYLALAGSSFALMSIPLLVLSVLFLNRG